MSTRIPDKLTKYNTWVLNNAQKVSQMESVLRQVMYLIPGRFKDSEVLLEFGHSSLALVSLYHDLLFLNQKEEQQLAGVDQSQTSSNTFLDAKRKSEAIDIPDRFLAHKQWRTALTVIETVQVLVEVCAREALGDEGKMGIIYAVEAVKAVMKLGLLRDTVAQVKREQVGVGEALLVSSSSSNGSRSGDGSGTGSGNVVLVESTYPPLRTVGREHVMKEKRNRIEALREQQIKRIQEQKIGIGEFTGKRMRKRLEKLHEQRKKQKQVEDDDDDQEGGVDDDDKTKDVMALVWEWKNRLQVPVSNAMQ